MYTNIYENTDRGEVCASVLSASDALLGLRGVVLLPIPTSPDGIHLGRGSVPLLSALERESCGVLYAGYGIPTDFCEKVRAEGGYVCDSLGDEGFLQDNAYLTAVGAVGQMILLSSRSPRDMCVGVVGYGRIGSIIVRLLLALGASVRVYTGRESIRLELGEMGIDTSSYTPLASFEGLNLLINTAPARVLRPPDTLKVMELASGDNFQSGEVVKYPALPARMFPYSAGRAWATSIERFVRGGMSFEWEGGA